MKMEELYYNDEQTFKNGFYENGSIAVYTVYLKGFASYSWFGVKVDI